MIPTEEGHWWHKRDESEEWPVYVKRVKQKLIVNYSHEKDLASYGGEWLGRVMPRERGEGAMRVLGEILRHIKTSDDTMEVGEWVEAMRGDIEDVLSYHQGETP